MIVRLTLERLFLQVDMGDPTRDPHRQFAIGIAQYQEAALCPPAAMPASLEIVFEWTAYQQLA